MPALASPLTLLDDAVDSGTDSGGYNVNKTKDYKDK